jgi:phage terminase small subunit
MKTTRPLTDQQRLFAKHYADLNNGTEAARKAGYSPKSAQVSAHRMLKDERILALIASWEVKATARELVTEARLEQELEYAALLDVRRVFDPATGRLLAPADIDEETARAIASFKVTTRKVGKDVEVSLADIKFVDKLQAIHKLGQQRGMFIERKEYTHKLEDLTTEQLEAELARIRAKHGEVAQAVQDSGVVLN